MLWLAIHFPNLALEVFTSPQRNIQNPCPSVVIHRNKIVAINSAAAKAGVLPNTSLVTAKSITNELQYFKKDSSKEIKELANLSGPLHQFSSMISIAESDCLLIEVGKSLKLFTTEEMLVKIHHLYLELGYTTQIRFSKSILEAIILATTGAEHIQEADLGLARLGEHGISSSVQNAMADMGFSTFKDLLNLSRAELGKRFGKEIPSLLSKLDGQHNDPQEHLHISESFKAEKQLIQAVRSKGPYLDKQMLDLAIELERWLTKRNLNCEKLEWQFSEHTKKTTLISVDFSGGAQSHQEFLHVTRLRIENEALPFEVLTIKLAAKLTSERQSTTDCLISSSRKRSSLIPNHDASQLVNRLRARLGSDACLQLRTEPHHSPESSWAKDYSLNLEEIKWISNKSIYKKRPLWLLKAPKPVPINQFSLIEGPEKIQTEWWNQSSSRAYYIAQHQSGSVCWIYKYERPVATKNTSTEETFYLHGYFG